MNSDIALNLVLSVAMFCSGMAMLLHPERAIARSGAGRPRTTRIVGAGFSLWGASWLLATLYQFLSE